MGRLQPSSFGRFLVRPGHRLSASQLQSIPRGRLFHPALLCTSLSRYSQVKDLQEEWDLRYPFPRLDDELCRSLTPRTTVLELKLLFTRQFIHQCRQCSVYVRTGTRIMYWTWFHFELGFMSFSSSTMNHCHVSSPPMDSIYGSYDRSHIRGI